MLRPMSGNPNDLAFRLNHIAGRDVDRRTESSDELRSPVCQYIGFPLINNGN